MMIHRRQYIRCAIGGNDTLPPCVTRFSLAGGVPRLVSGSGADVSGSDTFTSRPLPAILTRHLVDWTIVVGLESPTLTTGTFSTPASPWSPLAFFNTASLRKGVAVPHQAEGSTDQLRAYFTVGLDSFGSGTRNTYLSVSENGTTSGAGFSVVGGAGGTAPAFSILSPQDEIDISLRRSGTGGGGLLTVSVLIYGFPLPIDPASGT